MSVLGTIVIGWLALNVALFTGLLLRRPRPELRHKLFRWVVGGRPRHEPSQRGLGRSVGR
jgi:hypothetical protein